MDDTPEALADLRQTLTRNEASDQDVVLVYFNQGVLTGDWDGPHISPIAAYDQGAGQVLIMDVDREWYVPYWTADTTLLEAMLRPAPAEHGPLAGETGGLVWIKPASPRQWTVGAAQGEWLSGGPPARGSRLPLRRARFVAHIWAGSRPSAAMPRPAPSPPRRRR